MRSLSQEERETIHKCIDVLLAQIETLITEHKIFSKKVALELYPDEAMFLCSTLLFAYRLDKKKELFSYQHIPIKYSTTDTKRNKVQYVYLIHALGTNRYKIGRTTDLQSRMTQMATGTPFKINLVISFQTENSLEQESILHKKLADYRVHGEWFEFSSEQLEEVKELFSSQLVYSLE